MNGDCFLRLLVRMFVVVFLAGCAAAKDESFTLPKGNTEQGRATFIKFRCYDCHRVQGVDLPPGEEPNQAVVELGGAVEHLKTYGDLVTSIVNPSHRLAKGYTPVLVSQDGNSNFAVCDNIDVGVETC